MRGRIPPPPPEVSEKDDKRRLAKKNCFRWFTLCLELEDTSQFSWYSNTLRFLKQIERPVLEEKHSKRKKSCPIDDCSSIPFILIIRCPIITMNLRTLNPQLLSPFHW